MDDRLVRWARAVKSRRTKLGAGGLPPLWLFTDAARMADVVAAVRRLPKGLCGVVFRHDGAAGRTDLVRAVLRVCRARRLALVAAGRPMGLAGVGAHLRGGRRAGVPVPGQGLRTASAHGVADIVRARRAGAAAVFLSPAHPTRSHPGAPALGAVRWAAMARGRGIAVLALGGIDGITALRLPRSTAGAGAIGALLADDRLGDPDGCR